jgi:hypothetical protein
MDTQEAVDKFYWNNGKCCAGCDYWRHHNSVVGECTKSNLMSSRDRIQSTGIINATINIGGGHALTTREMMCGNFKDDFDWSSLPILYQKQVGVKQTEG